MPLLGNIKQSYTWLAAEFVVIVMGVLVAFQVEEWRQDREERELEAASLRLLLTDIERGRDEYLNVQETNALLKENAATLLGFLLDPATLGKDVSDIPAVSLPTRQWEPTNAAFSSLRDSGRLGLISNQALQSDLLYYFDLSEPYFHARRLNHSEMAVQTREILDDLIFVQPRPDYLETGQADRVMQVSMAEFVRHQELLETLIQLEGGVTDSLSELAGVRIEQLDELESQILAHLETL